MKNQKKKKKVVGCVYFFIIYTFMNLTNCALYNFFILIYMFSVFIIWLKIYIYIYNEFVCYLECNNNNTLRESEVLEFFNFLFFFSTELCRQDKFTEITKF